MENNFNKIRVYLFKELKKIATLPKKIENEEELNIEDRIRSMEKIVNMLKESLDLIDEDVENKTLEFKSPEEELDDDLPIF